MKLTANDSASSSHPYSLELLARPSLQADDAHCGYHDDDDDDDYDDDDGDDDDDKVC